jgi:hypothetical protein
VKQINITYAFFITHPSSEHGEQAHPSSEHGEQEHPSSEHGEQEHPSSEHGEQAHPSSEHGEQDFAEVRVLKVTLTKWSFREAEWI